MNEKGIKGITLVEFVCEWCGEKFLSRSHNAKYCPECKETRDSEGNMSPSRRRNPNKVLFALLQKIDKYNRKNGTHLSYGKYVDAVYRKQ